MWPNTQFPADLIAFTEEIFHGKLYFLCSIFCLGEKPVKVIQFQILHLFKPYRSYITLWTQNLRLKDLQSLTNAAFFTMHMLTIQPFSYRILSLSNTWLMVFIFFVLFWIKTKLNKIWICGYWNPKRGSSGSLWYALYRSKEWYIEHISYSFRLQWKIKRGKKVL